MTRTTLVAVPLICVVVALAVLDLHVVAAVSVGAVLGVALALALWGIERRRVGHLARVVNRWLGEVRHDPVTVPQTPVWQELAVALNALGSAYDRRGRRLERARQLRIGLVDVLPDPALLFDEDGYLVRANPIATSRFAIPTAESLTVAQSLGAPQLTRAVDEARDVGHAIEADITLDDRDLIALAAPVGDEVLLVVTDQTERRRVDAVRRDFVANASHELKTPVSGIQALAEALVVTLDRDPQRARALASRLSDEADRLGKLVHHLLDLRRLEESDDVGRVPVDLVEVLRNEISRLAPSAGARGIVLADDLPDRAVIVGAEDDLRLIVANLLDNAVGYNEDGGRVDVELRRQNGGWQLVVRDSGIGIAGADLDRIFERFYRVDVARSRATGGTGLGLSIVRHAVDRQGGVISVDSILGEGTTFRVTLPVEPPR